MEDKTTLHIVTFSGNNIVIDTMLPWDDFMREFIGLGYIASAYGYLARNAIAEIYRVTEVPDGVQPFRHLQLVHNADKPS